MQQNELTELTQRKGFFIAELKISIESHSPVWSACYSKRPGPALMNA